MQLALVPASLMPWLLLEDSMTACIAQAFGRTPEVAVHFSGPDQLRTWEHGCLGDAARKDPGFARHISLEVDSQPVLLARSVTYRGNTIEPLLSELQTTPLARLLFEDARWSRAGAPLPLNVHNVLFGRACIWQRADSDQRLLVEEFFNFAVGDQSTNA